MDAAPSSLEGVRTRLRRTPELGPDACVPAFEEIHRGLQDALAAIEEQVRTGAPGEPTDPAR